MFPTTNEQTVYNPFSIIDVGDDDWDIEDDELGNDYGDLYDDEEDELESGDVKW